MPFDFAQIIGADTDPAARSRLSYETRGASFVQDWGHIDDQTVLLLDGSLLTVLAVPGYEFELVGMRERNIRRRQFNDLLRGIAADNVVLGFHLIHHAHVDAFPLGRFRSAMARQTLETYQRHCLGGLVANDWFLTVLVHPSLPLLQKAAGRLARFRGRQQRPQAPTALVRQLTGICRNLLAYLEPQGARRLGIRHDPGGFACSEIAEVRHMILTGRFRPTPLTTGVLGHSIYTDRATCGTKLIQLDGIDGPRFAKTIALRDYPASREERDGSLSGGTRTGQWSHLLRLEHTPFVLAQTFRFQSRGESENRLYFTELRMENAFSPDTEALDALSDVRGEIKGGNAVRGHHNWGLTVFGDTPEAVRSGASAAGAAIIRAGCIPIQEDGASFAAYWNMLPGQPKWMEGRSGSVATKNLTAFASFEAFPRGQTKRGHWGAPILRFATSGGTAYDFGPHVSDVGHALFLGRTGSGKTVLLTLLMLALEQTGATVVYLDKDHGAEPAIRSGGGTYLTLRAGEPSGLNPLQGLSNTPENRAFLVQWITALMTAETGVPLRPQTAAMLARAVARQMRMDDPQDRSLGGVRAFLGYGEGTDGARLEQWCEGGAQGWLFDGGPDLVSLSARLIGFDMTALLKHPACPMVGAYMVHRIRELLDGRRVAVICDECRFYLLSSQFAAMIEDFALTMRKLNGMLWLAAQEPDHITESSVGASLASQAQTIWAFPSTDADPAQYIGKLGFTAPMFRTLTEEMPAMPERTVMLKREGGSAILKVELTNMDDEIAILSGREENTRLIPDILADIGDDAEAFVREFTLRVRAQRRESGGRSTRPAQPSAAPKLRRIA